MAMRRRLILHKYLQYTIQCNRSKVFAGFFFPVYTYIYCVCHIWLLQVVIGYNCILHAQTTCLRQTWDVCGICVPTPYDLDCMIPKLIKGCTLSVLLLPSIVIHLFTSICSSYTALGWSPHRAISESCALVNDTLLCWTCNRVLYNSYLLVHFHL